VTTAQRYQRAVEAAGLAWAEFTAALSRFYLAATPADATAKLERAAVRLGNARRGRAVMHRRLFVVVSPRTPHARYIP
jgi:hypothetical protein